ncbi:WD repeat-containing protein 36 [Lethenteron reissneri]|uniref:WD repeat-containing protein 36 n=1 Tax=Lethenteron reissneri TaxID=7753 RepID=UPI002AB77F5C|nr:WD repeat-containing protein 36 [Lethenteron reissneri]
MSRVFEGFRALGLYTGPVPHVVRVHRRHQQAYVLTAVGPRLHAYNVNKLGIVSISNALPEDISCLAANRMLAFAAYGSKIATIARGKEVVHTYEGHSGEVHLLLPFGDHLVSVDRDNVLVVWDVQTEEEYLRLEPDPQVFGISAVVHPSTYMNKVLLGSRQGPLQLWNLKTGKLLFTFKGWGSEVTCLEQAPAVDVVGVGLQSGSVLLHNIKVDETLMKFHQDWGPVTCISFRTDGPAVMATGSSLGHIALWDLHDRKLLAQMRDTHAAAIAGATFIHNEPLLLTTAGDNAIKVWVFESAGGSPRLLRERCGHSAPPTSIRHHGQDGFNILSAGQDGTLQSFSVVHDRFNKSLGRGSINKKKSKKKGLKLDTMKLPPICAFASETARQSDWDGIVSCHRGFVSASTWSFLRGSMGSHRLEPENMKRNRTDPTTATAVTVSPCGNFAIIGLSSGHVNVYNLQSGLPRGSFGSPTAHRGHVRAVALDHLGQMAVSVGGDSALRVWSFKSRALLHETVLPAAPGGAILHRDSGLLAVWCDDLSVLVFDVEMKKIVRVLNGHGAQITDATFSPDGRWLLTASMDRSVRTWDLPSGCLVDVLAVSSPVVSLSMSPTGDYLATALSDHLGIYLWSNRSMYTHVSLRPLPADYEPRTEALPGGAAHGGDVAVREDEDFGDDVDGGDEAMVSEFHSPEQLSESLVTLSSVPESRWKNLLNLDVIRKRNKPKEPPRAPEKAPFFLPTTPGLTPAFCAPANADSQAVTKVVQLGHLNPKSEFSRSLEEAWESNDFSGPLGELSSLPPGTVESELRALGPAWGGSPLLLAAFLRSALHGLRSRGNFQLLQAQLALFLKLHLRELSEHEEVVRELAQVSVAHEDTWAEVQHLMLHTLCVLGYTRSALF